MQKTVWRVNKGGGVPIDFKAGVFMFDGVKRFSKIYAIDDVLWTIESEPSSYCIYAYETNRTREAKYTRVECEYCESKGLIFIEYLYSTCTNCHMRGYIWEAIK